MSGIRDISGWRRLVLLVGGGGAVALAVVTLSGAIPRPVTITLRVADPPPSGLLVRTYLWSGDETVAEGTDVAHRRDGEVIQYRFWLSPGEHRLEVHARGCAVRTREFDPAETRTVHLLYRCDSGGAP